MTTLTIVTEADAGWDEARQAWSLTADQRPAAIAQPASADEVVAAIEFARGNGLRVAAQGTGHNAKPLGALTDTLLIRTAAMRQVNVDPDRMTSRVEAGVLSQELTDAAARHDLTGLMGSSVDVGVIGYTLGGGMGWLGRKYGLAASNVTAVEAVTADGRLVRADAAHETDLFWALRGGGGSFAVVTALESRLFPVATVCGGLLWWPIEHAPEVLPAWRELTVSGLPDEFTTTARLMRFPDLPRVPDPVRGRSFVIIDVVHLGSQAEADKILAPLRALGPATDTVAMIPARELGPLHMDPDRPVPGAGDCLLLDSLPAAAIDEVLGLAGPGVSTALSLVELRQIGGEMRRTRPDSGALAALDADYALVCGGTVASPESAAAIDREVQEFKTALAPWAGHGEYLNFAGSSRNDPAGFWEPAAYKRLRQIKAAVDPENRIRSNHPVPLPG
jgi:FAD/FMN-containing dehydrogenase